MFSTQAVDDNEARVTEPFLSAARLRRGACLLTVLVAVSCAHTPVIDAPAAGAPEPREEVFRDVVLTSRNPAGTHVVTRRGNKLTVDWDWNDRGRGDKTHSEIELDARGWPVSVHIVGNDYFKSPFEESFTLKDGTATWKNPAESETVRRDGFYLPLQPPPAYTALLAKALLADPDHSIPFLPAGTATIENGGSLEVGDRRLTLWEINGLDVVPVTVWLDENNDYFASGSALFSHIRAGYETHVQTLFDRAQARSQERLAAIAQRQTRIPANDTLFVRNARVFNLVTLQVSDPSTIEVRGKRIVRVVAGDLAAPAGVEVFDAAGKMVIPGLWDMHSHVNDADGITDIAAGVTGIHDVGNSEEMLVPLKARFENGSLIGPRVYMRALIDGPGPLQAPTNLLVSNEGEARAVIDKLASLGYEGIKIYSSIKPELVPFLTKYAREKGLGASGHIPAGMTASQAIDAGYDEIHHINMLFLNFWPDVKDTNSTLRFTAVADRGPSLDLKSPEVQAFIEKLKATDTTVDPTLVVFEWIFVWRTGVTAPSYAAIADRLPANLQRWLRSGGGLPVTPANDARHLAAFRKMQDFVAELNRSGVRVVTGTDMWGGFSLQRELELYSDAGIPNAEVLRIGTWNPVVTLGLEKELGTIEAGKLADFLIVDGDPTRNMSDIRKVVLVVKDGRMFLPDELLAELGIRPEAQ